MNLRPYKTCDAKYISEWVQDEDVFLKWGGKLFGSFPIDAGIIDDKYVHQNGNCKEDDNFYPWVAYTDEEGVVGHFIMRYIHGDKKNIRFGWVVVNGSIRGKGFGTQMLTLGLDYAFNFLGAEVVSIGVFENNEPAHNCYRKVGFKDREIVEGDPWRVVEMEIKREDF